MVAVYHGNMLTKTFITDMREWFTLLRQLGQEELSVERMRRMTQIEFQHRHNNFAGLAMAMMREEYTKDLGYLALRIRWFDEYFKLPWYKRIFSRPSFPEQR